MSLSYGFCLGEQSSVYSSEQVAAAFRAVAGDGISPNRARMAVSVNGFTVTVGTGYALAAGHWLENDEPLTIGLEPASNNEDRIDALVVRVDQQTRKAALEILVDVDLDKLPGKLRTDKTYSIVLYLIRVRRGVTYLTPEDVTDMRTDPASCGTVVPLSAIAGNVSYIYDYLTGGIDAEVARLIGLSDKVITKADAAIAELDTTIQQAGGTASIGELMTARHRPLPEAEWLPCDGSAVPARYPALSVMLEGALPAIQGERYKTYIYGGVPVGEGVI